MVVGGKLVAIVELIGPVASGVLGDDACGFDHVAGKLLGHASAVAGEDFEARAEDAHVVELLSGESIGADDVKGVALHGADQRQRDAGAAAGVFDDRDAG